MTFKFVKRPECYFDFHVIEYLDAIKKPAEKALSVLH